MFEELYRYGIAYKNLPVPGIGTFTWETIPARSDFPNKLLYPPSYRVQFGSATHVPGAFFFQWLGKSLGISSRDAVFRFNDFAFGLRKDISEGAVVNWKGVGILQKGLGGEIKFSPELPEMLIQAPVHAERIIRENAEHLIRVGEEQRSSTEMTALLSKSATAQRSYPVIIGWALLLAATGFSVWHFINRGAVPEAVANSKPLNASGETSTYRMLQE